MNRTRFSPAAQDDLSAIWDYTVHNWGVASSIPSFLFVFFQ